jgi:hypothetical protein
MYELTSCLPCSIYSQYISIIRINIEDRFAETRRTLRYQITETFQDVQLNISIGTNVR